MSNPNACPSAKRLRKAERRRRHGASAENVRILHLVQRLLLRDMRRQNLSLRGAARDGGVSVGTLFFVLDEDRVRDPTKQPKRRPRRSTLLLLRAMPWIGSRTATTLDRLLGAEHKRTTAPVSDRHQEGSRKGK